MAKWRKKKSYKKRGKKKRGKSASRVRIGYRL